MKLKLKHKFLKPFNTKEMLILGNLSMFFLLIVILSSKSFLLLSDFVASMILNNIALVKRLKQGIHEFIPYRPFTIV